MHTKRTDCRDKARRRNETGYGMKQKRKEGIEEDGSVGGRGSFQFLAEGSDLL